jgi:hypothetical protein
MIPRQIILHHSASSRDKTTIKDINAWHKLRWPDFKSSLGYFIGYHFVITADGTITKTRQSEEIGAHCIPNEGRVGICLTGNFDVETPTLRQLDSLGGLLVKLKSIYQLKDTDIFGHCELAKTACPGKNLFIWVKEYRQIGALQKIIIELKRLLGIK